MVRIPDWIGFLRREKSRRPGNSGGDKNHKSRNSGPATSRVRARSNGDEDGDLRRIAWLFSALSIVAVAVLAARAWRAGDFATYAMWAIACSMAGTAIGFLFGIPKVLQSDTPPDGAGAKRPSYRQEINTNLTEISDWLTKIIVGLSLINLRRIPEILNGAADLLVSSVSTTNQPGARGFATAVITSFSILGFLFGYLSTRMFLAVAFARADQRAAGKQAETELQLAALVVDVSMLKQQVLSKSTAAATGGTQHIAPARVRTKETGGNETDPLDRLLSLAQEYLEIPSDLPYGPRLQMKDEAADRMANLILQTGDKRDAVVALAERSRNEGVAIALATVINFKAGPRDPARLLSVATWVTRWHVQYRIVAAFGTLFRARLLSLEETRAVVTILNHYRVKADESLLKAIDSALATIAPEGESRSAR